MLFHERSARTADLSEQAMDHRWTPTLWRTALLSKLGRSTYSRYHCRQNRLDSSEDLHSPEMEVIKDKAALTELRAFRLPHRLVSSSVTGRKAAPDPSSEHRDELCAFEPERGASRQHDASRRTCSETSLEDTLYSLILPGSFLTPVPWNARPAASR